MKVIILSPAADEAQSAADHYRNIRPELEQAFRAELNEAFDLLGTTPQAWPTVTARHRFILLRRFSYKILYRIAQHHVVVVAVAHTSRRPQYWRGRPDRRLS